MDPTDQPQDWNRTTAALRRLAQAIVRDAGDSEDIVQAAFLSALRRPKGTTTVGWLRSVVRSRAIDHRRRSGRGPRHLPIDESASDAPGGRAPDEIAERIELQRELLLAVKRLGDPYREVVYLRYFEDLGPTRIALRLGLPVKTVKSQLERGLQRLRAQRADRGAGLHALAFGLPRISPLVIVQQPFRLAAMSALTMKYITVGAVLVIALLTTWMLSSDHGERATLDHERDVAITPNGGDTQALATPEPVASDRKVAATESGPAVATENVATEPAEAHATGTLQVHVLWSHGAHAENVGVVVVTKATSRGVKRYLRGVTNTAGMATFDGLPPGETILRVDRGAARERRNWLEKPEIIAGETITIELQLDKGIDVVGHVRGADGTPVADAGIWLTARSSGWTGGRVVTRTDAGGAFQLRAVPGDQSLGALVPGLARSKLVDLDMLDTSAGQATVELMVAGASGALEGTVVDGDGNAIAGAIVVLGSWRGFQDTRSDGTIKEGWTPPSARTQPDGSFRLDAIAQGEQVVRVRATGFPTWSGQGEVRAGASTRLNIVLLPGATLAGRVTDAGGKPVSGARVHVFERPLDETFLISGQVDYDSPLAHTAAITDDAGDFLVEQVPSGQVWAYAQAPRAKQRRLQETVLYSKIQLDLDPGEAARWDPVLDTGRTIRGTVSYRDGALMTGIFVNAREVDGKDSRAIYSEDGAFAFIQLAGAAYDISAQIWEPPPGAGRVEVLGAVPDGDPVRVVADFDAPIEFEPTTVHVRFEDAGHRALDASSVGVRLENTEHYSWRIGDLVEGVWAFELDKPGTFRPMVFAGDRVIAVGEEFVAVPGTTHDLGTLLSKRGGDVLFRLRWPDGAARESLRATLKHAAFRHSESFEIDPIDEYRIENVEPGAASLSLRGTLTARTSIDFEVEPERETVVIIDLIPAVAVPYKISWSSRDNPGATQIRFLDRADGSEVYARTLEDAASYSNPIEWTFLAPIGEFTLVVEQANGKAGRMDFDVTSLDASAAPSVEIDLR